MQNLVLAVQNVSARSDLGAASSVVSFFRSLGGSIGAGATGAAHRTSEIPVLSALPAPVRALYESAFGEATGHLFLIAAPFAMLALVCVLFIREVPLRRTIQRVDEAVPEESKVLVGVAR